MEAKDVLRFQLDGSFNQVRDRVQAASDEEWDARAVPGASKVGFVAWHCARSIDWAVNCAIQGRPETADAPEWRQRLAVDEGLFGAGIPDAVADTVPARVGRAAVLEYLAAVRPGVLEWLEEQDAGSLERVPDLRAHLAAKPGYLEPGVWSEIEDFVGAPAWHYLARPAISHIRVHMGEVDALLSALRASADLMPAS